jgi:DNA-binding MarR family transcriptional regulator
VLDRRIVTIHLTEDGNEVAKRAPLPIPTTMVDGLNKLPVEETRKIVQSLATLVAMLDQDSV